MVFALPHHMTKHHSEVRTRTIYFVCLLFFVSLWLAFLSNLFFYEYWYGIWLMMLFFFTAWPIVSCIPRSRWPRCTTTPAATWQSPWSSRAAEGFRRFAYFSATGFSARTEPLRSTGNHIIFTMLLLWLLCFLLWIQTLIVCRSMVWMDEVLSWLITRVTRTNIQ